MDRYFCCLTWAVQGLGNNRNSFTPFSFEIGHFSFVMTTRYLRIHGDNIVECERTLKMIGEAFKAKYDLMNSPIYFPKYVIKTTDVVFIIELLSGHGRWSKIDLGDIIHKSGGKLRESADSYITEIRNTKEYVLLGIEYCSALPAGNNAWQRNGRALASVFANVPYLYYAEIGGIELDESRNPKAPRYPNPAVPFSYISLSYDMDSICLPVYRAHPSMTTSNLQTYKESLGYEDGLVLIKNIINGEDTSPMVNVLTEKALTLVKILSNSRRTKDTLRGDDWNKLLRSNDRAAWLANYNGFQWKKKSSDKVYVSNTFNLLKAEVELLSAKPITAKDLPFCVIPKRNLSKFKEWIRKTYSGLNANFALDKDLAIVWITGFKPRGDDSRPDRGLSPLCRMILGKDANIMAVVSGPGTSYTWNLLSNNPKSLCDNNGLFQAIFMCCNYLFVDSATCSEKLFIPTNALLSKNVNTITFPYISKPVVPFFEHDTDCAIHQILSNHTELGIYECFCNPPGGDWSGISYFRKNDEFKWTSLPRVSDKSKRPDHIFQIERNGRLYFVPIESKGYGKDLENNIGNRLKDYISDLFTSEPTAFKTVSNPNWRFFNGSIGKVTFSLLSVGAFLYTNEAELRKHLIRGNLDAIFAFEFGTQSTLHFYSNQDGKILIDYLNTISSEQGSFVVKIH